MLVNRTAKATDPHVVSLIEELVPGGVPIVLVPDPTEGAVENDCTTIVESAVTRCGGAAVYGWALWEMTGVLVEAEFHAVWRSPGGELRDLSPMPANLASRLFLPDPGLVYEGRQINNIRRPIDDHPSVQRLINAMDAHFLMFNKGKRAKQHGRVRIPFEEREPILRELAAAQLAVVTRMTAPKARTRTDHRMRAAERKRRRRQEKKARYEERKRKKR